VAGSNTYSALLRDRRWQRKRLQIFQRDRWRCTADDCPDPDRQEVPLHVHHLRYLTGCLPWDYPDELLVTWCEKCHYGRHGRF
jgi:5-methylcytosine-specific restriction endonuclease McrA